MQVCAEQVCSTAFVENACRAFCLDSKTAWLTSSLDDWHTEATRAVDDQSCQSRTAIAAAVMCCTISPQWSWHIYHDPLDR
jgi:hypothetical protein